MDSKPNEKYSPTILLVLPQEVLLGKRKGSCTCYCKVVIEHHVDGSFTLRVGLHASGFGN